ncbi:MAG: methionyl-tRNA formyltransferase [Kiritimatiellae bacterium]|nr:methionyl-tRNA formyltransferase [Kiritimatiellia bacterium]
MRIVFMGSSAASATCLEAILKVSCLEVVGVVTPPDRPVGRGKMVMPCPCKAYASSRGISEIITPDNVNSEQSMAQLKAWSPDAIVVVAFGQFLKKPILDLPPLGCINCHFSLLPKYRGAAPVVAAIAAGDRLTGVTVMKMGIGMDDGPIMMQRYEPICSDTTGGMLMDELAIAGGVALAKALKLLNDGQLPPPVMQNDEDATFAYKLKKSDGLIDWASPVLVIDRKIRAYSPWPGSFTFLPERFRRKGNSGRLVVLKAEMAGRIAPEQRDADPGTVIAIDDKGRPVVRCGDTALRLLVVKPEGSSEMPAAAFLRGRPITVGEKLLDC